MKRIFFWLVSTLAGLVMYGCSPSTPTDVIKPVWLNSLRTNSTTHVAVTVGPDGTKHFVWDETNLADKYYLVYTKSSAGEFEGRIIIEGAGSGELWMKPDIAVTDSGEVLIVWHADHGSGVYLDYFMSITHPELGTLVQQDYGSYSPQHSQPRIVAFQNSAYVVYEQMVSGHRQLHYRQVRPTYGERTGYADSPLCADVDENSIDLKISEYWDTPDTSCPMLHVAFNCENGLETYYANNRCENADMPVFHSPVYVGVPRSKPSLEITNNGSENLANIIMRFADPAEDPRLILSYCTLPNCTTGFTDVDLLSGNWLLAGDPDTDTIPIPGGADIRVAFRGNPVLPKGAEAQQEAPKSTDLLDIWTTHYQYGTVLSPYRIINTPAIQESNPRVIYVDELYAVLYRIVESGAAKIGDWYGDVFLFDPINDNRKIFSAGVTVQKGYFDIDANGGFGGGIWISNLGDTFRPVPWVSMNAFLINLPIIFH